MSIAMQKKFFILMILSCLGVLLSEEVVAKVYKPEDIPNVHLRDKTQYVSDPDHRLRPETINKVNSTLGRMADSTTVETAMVIVDDIGDTDIYDFALALGRNWGVGKKDKNNGLVVVFALNQKQVRIQTGSGAEGVLPDIAAKRLIDRHVIPNMRSGDIDNAVMDLSQGLYEVFTDPAAAAELKSEQKEGLDEDLGKIFLFYCTCIGLITLVYLFYNLWKMRKMDNYRRALACRENRWVFVLLSFLSLGFGLPALGIYLLLGYYYRNHKRKCDVCGTHMHKLSEKDDNAYLTAEQNQEEHLKSVDYDVWLCPKCETTEIFPFVSHVTKYKTCPKCHYRTLGLLYDRVERKPTHATDGSGVKVFQCKNCNHRHEEHYKIPKRETAVFIGGGGFGGRGGGGGGISGGSWGGGGFSGGGASGSW